MLLSRLVLIELERSLEVRQLHLTQDAARGHGAPVEEVAPTWEHQHTGSVHPSLPKLAVLSSILSSRRVALLVTAMLMSAGVLGVASA